MAFLQNGNEIAYVQYNKMHINAIEAMDRMSVGAAADGGYFDFISTIYGMGVKWRAVTQCEMAGYHTDGNDYQGSCQADGAPANSIYTGAG